MTKRRGRPIGYKLSEASKRAISESKKGQKHTQETRNKISRTLTLYFRRLRPLSEEIINRYCRIDDDELCEWANNVREDLDYLDDVITDRYLRTTTKMEIAYGDDIEYFSHELTPEAILLLKEYCASQGINLEDYL